jgi:hypothetical protein
MEGIEIKKLQENDNSEAGLLGGVVVYTCGLRGAYESRGRNKDTKIETIVLLLLLRDFLGRVPTWVLLVHPVVLG